MSGQFGFGATGSSPPQRVHSGVLISSSTEKERSSSFTHQAGEVPHGSRRPFRPTRSGSARPWPSTADIVHGAVADGLRVR